MKYFLFFIFQEGISITVQNERKKRQTLISRIGE